MLNDNIKALRKARGITQEELAAKLHVVRQTVSKWEKGLSVPDAELLGKLADELEVPVAELLGAPIAEPAEQNAVAEQLARINEQLVIKNRRARRIWRTVAIVLGAVVALNLILAVLGITVYSVQTGSEGSATVYETEETVLTDEGE